jgi:hypothetical protein
LSTPKRITASAAARLSESVSMGSFLMRRKKPLSAAG